MEPMGAIAAIKEFPQDLDAHQSEHSTCPPDLQSGATYLSFARTCKDSMVCTNDAK